MQEWMQTLCHKATIFHTSFQYFIRYTLIRLQWASKVPFYEIYMLLNYQIKNYRIRNMTIPYKKKYPGISRMYNCISLTSSFLYKTTMFNMKHKKSPISEILIQTPKNFSQCAFIEELRLSIICWMLVFLWGSEHHSV